MLLKKPIVLVWLIINIYRYIHMTIRVTDIVYDTDGETDLDLPSEMTLVINESLDIETLIVDTISDSTGWCVQGYNYEIL